MTMVVEHVPGEGVLGELPAIDRAGARRAVRDLLVALGADPEHEELRDTPRHSLCRHHLLPFGGMAHVAYLPAERIVGLSKLARVVEAAARGLQVQEQLTSEVADVLEQRLAPRGVGVVLAAAHSCMTMRGVRASGAVTVTSAVRGVLRDDARTRAEFFALARARAGD